MAMGGWGEILFSNVQAFKAPPPNPKALNPTAMYHGNCAHTYMHILAEPAGGRGGRGSGKRGLQRRALRGCGSRGRRHLREAPGGEDGQGAPEEDEVITHCCWIVYSTRARTGEITQTEQAHENIGFTLQVERIYVTKCIL